MTAALDVNSNEVQYILALAQEATEIQERTIRPMNWVTFYHKHHAKRSSDSWVRFFTDRITLRRRGAAHGLALEMLGWTIDEYIDYVCDDPAQRVRYEHCYETILACFT